MTILSLLITIFSLYCHHIITINHHIFDSYVTVYLRVDLQDFISVEFPSHVFWPGHDQGTDSTMLNIIMEISTDTWSDDGALFFLVMEV